MIHPRRLEWMLAKQAERLKRDLAAVSPGEFAPWNEFPDWIRRELDVIIRTTAIPDATLPEKASAGEVAEWMRGFIGDSRDWYLLTRLADYPWLRIQPAGSDWVRELGDDFTLVASTKDVLVACHAEEHYYQAFRRVSR